jgi:hypothetical protein
MACSSCAAGSSLPAIALATDSALLPDSPLAAGRDLPAGLSIITGLLLIPCHIVTVNITVIYLLITEGAIKFADDINSLQWSFPETKVKFITKKYYT